MKSPRDPIRWADPGSDAPHELAAAIRSLRAIRGSAEQVEALSRRLASQLATPVPAAAGTAIAPWLKVTVVLLSGAIGLYALSRPHQAERSRVHLPQAQPPATTPVASPLPATALPQAPPAPVLPPRPRARTTSKQRATGAAGASAPVSGPAPERELVLLQRSQSALDRDPGAALALAEEHARDYPRGVFAQEREILAIEALLKLRRRPEALARAELFLQRYAESPHSRRVRALLERSHGLAPATTQDGTAHPKEVPMPHGGGDDPR